MEDRFGKEDAILVGSDEVGLVIDLFESFFFVAFILVADVLTAVDDVGCFPALFGEGEVMAVLFVLLD
jgi:hypothetical protein